MRPLAQSPARPSPRRRGRDARPLPAIGPERRRDRDLPPRGASAAAAAEAGSFSWADSEAERDPPLLRERPRSLFSPLRSGRLPWLRSGPLCGVVGFFLTSTSSRGRPQRLQVSLALKFW